jgi:ketosteroid isomerase-like protein
VPEGRLGEDKVVELTHDLMRAVQNRDVATVERILAGEFTLTTGRPGAEVRSRDEWLDVTRDRYTLDSYDFDWIEPRVYGHVAVVRSRYHQTGTLDRDDRTSAYLMTDVWVRRAGRWQIVTRHLSALAEAT